MWRYTQCCHRVFNGRQSRATEFQKYCFLFSYSTVRSMAIARLCLSLQLQWRHWEYRHLACSDLSNIQETLPWLVREWPSSGHLLASSNLQPNSTFSIIKLHISLPTKVAQVFGCGIHIKKNSTYFFIPKRWNRFFAIYVMRLALYMCIKNICNGVGRQNGSNALSKNWREEI
jgi:hypothetical protein